jgi:hypothetical protein
MPILFLQVYMADWNTDKSKFYARLQSDVTAGLTVVKTIETNNACPPHM